jgi:hypothetical protein
MTEELLLKRIEEQAVQIAHLKACLEEAQEKIMAFPDRLANFEKGIYEQMSRSAVNCGHSSACFLATQRLRQ